MYVSQCVCVVCVCVRVGVGVRMCGECISVGVPMYVRCAVFNRIMYAHRYPIQFAWYIQGGTCWSVHIECTSQSRLEDLLCIF